MVWSYEQKSQSWSYYNSILRQVIYPGSLLPADSSLPKDDMDITEITAEIQGSPLKLFI